MEECLNCGIKFNLSDLKNHMEECQFYGYILLLGTDYRIASSTEFSAITICHH